MPAPFQHGHTVHRLRGDKVDDGYGGTRIDWSNPDRRAIPGCGMAPLVADEQHQQGRQGVVVAWTLYTPHGADIGHDDRVETPHGVFAVDGEPGLWASPLSGRRHGMTVTLRRVDG